MIKNMDSLKRTVLELLMGIVISGIFFEILGLFLAKEKLFNMGCESACLTGSGSYVVGILNKKTTNCYQNYNLKSK